jgi:hypothetical protein
MQVEVSTRDDAIPVPQSFEQFTSQKLENLRDKIEQLSKSHQVEILRILQKDEHVRLNENKNGVLINLIDVSPRTLNHINIYLDYINKQEINLLQIEEKTEKIRNSFF